MFESSLKTRRKKALKEKKDNQGFLVFFCWPLRIRKSQDDDVLTNTHECVDLVYFFFLAAPFFLVAGDPFFEDTTFRFFCLRQTDRVREWVCGFSVSFSLSRVYSAC